MKEFMEQTISMKAVLIIVAVIIAIGMISSAIIIDINTFSKEEVEQLVAENIEELISENVENLVIENVENLVIDNVEQQTTQNP